VNNTSAKRFGLGSCVVKLDKARKTYVEAMFVCTRGFNYIEIEHANGRRETVPMSDWDSPLRQTTAALMRKWDAAKR
jgi:hypothetical protein